MALHCPAVVVIVALADDAQVEDADVRVADLLREENVAAVYSTGSRVATVTAARLAVRLGLAPPTEVVPGAEGWQAISDGHRGETVLVVDRAPAVGPNGRWVRSGARSATVAGGEGGARAVGPDATAASLDLVRLEMGDDGTRILPPRDP
ncbi:hypothetical protein GA707_01060 [Nostocoides sp. F2B08]|uniref:hypothetical protein n=1 Tax=Nostocoides sp. F2B08 TaxID=2653936 RepID=UPI0012632A72|nr:hypothetical protein [Tetrasphaera sp. F2B08]KAB7746152.1 hypothetical protein GA707_01060 [Tetrasphaera sp. F2B08]